MLRCKGKEQLLISTILQQYTEYDGAKKKLLPETYFSCGHCGWAFKYILFFLLSTMLSCLMHSSTTFTHVIFFFLIKFDISNPGNFNIREAFLISSCELPFISLRRKPFKCDYENCEYSSVSKQ